jgi:hypothetical protein
MPKSPIVVKVNEQGTVRDGVPEEDAKTEARCDLCGATDEAVASLALEGGAPFGCKNCLRERLESMTVSLWMFRSPASRGLPWGKISG